MLRSISFFVMVFSLFTGCALLKDNSPTEFPQFTTLESHQISTIESQVVRLEHKKSGATVVLVQNEDPARTFTAAFRTPPYDDTGLFHIFEHAVLAGSRKYPSKKAFFTLSDSSVASFINAYTASVHTGYPFVTKSEKEFNNMMSFYLDAVFFPNVVKDPRLIRREGWRYELGPDGKNFAINGIVLNEMKGYYANPINNIYYQVGRGTLPKTPYGYSAGGLPEKVATLTFEQIQDAHKQYYHPQNSILYFYGDIDYRRAMEVLDREFLTHFSRDPNYQRPEVSVQGKLPQPEKVFSATYPGEEGGKKDYTISSFLLGDKLTPIEESTAHVLMMALSSNAIAPLKLRVQKEELAKQTFYISTGSENLFAVVFEGTRSSDRPALNKILREEMERFATQGVDPELLTSILNSFEFSDKEKKSNGSHRGLSLGRAIIENWNFPKESLVDALDSAKHFRELRQRLADPEYVKEFIRTRFLNSEKKWVVLRPDANHAQSSEKQLEKQVRQAVREQGFANLKKKSDEFKEWVKAEEPAEITSRLPILKSEDLFENEKPLKFTKQNLGATEILKFHQPTAGISYAHFYFDLRAVPEQDLKKLPLLTMFLRETDTSDLDFKSLSKQIDTYFGGFAMDISTFYSQKTEDYKPSLVISIKYLNENEEKVFSLLESVLLKSQFSPASRANQLFTELQVSRSRNIARRAPRLSYQAATQKFSGERGHFERQTRGSSYESFLQNRDLKGEKIASEMKALADLVFNRDRLYLVSLTTEKSHSSTLLGAIQRFQSALPQSSVSKQKWTFADSTFYDGFAIPGGVQYNSAAAPLSEGGLAYNGSLLVFANYLESKYLYPRMREQLGAYGAYSWFQRSGEFVMFTYRDPHLEKSFEVMTGAPQFMGEQNFTRQNLWPSTLGALKAYYRDESVVDKTQKVTQWYLTDRDWTDHMKIKSEILSTTPADMATINRGLIKALEKSKKVVSGNQEKIKAEGQFLQQVLKIQ